MRSPLGFSSIAARVWRICALRSPVLAMVVLALSAEDRAQDAADHASPDLAADCARGALRRRLHGRLARAPLGAAVAAAQLVEDAAQALALRGRRLRDLLAGA